MLFRSDLPDVGAPVSRAGPGPKFWALGWECRRSLGPSRRLDRASHWVLSARHLHTGWRPQDSAGSSWGAGQVERRLRGFQEVGRAGGGGPGISPWAVRRELAVFWKGLHVGLELFILE